MSFVTVTLVAGKTLAAPTCLHDPREPGIMEHLEGLLPFWLVLLSALRLSLLANYYSSEDLEGGHEVLIAILSCNIIAKETRVRGPFISSVVGSYSGRAS